MGLQDQMVLKDQMVIREPKVSMVLMEKMVIKEVLVHEATQDTVTISQENKDHLENLEIKERR